MDEYIEEHKEYIDDLPLTDYELLLLDDRFSRETTNNQDPEKDYNDKAVCCICIGEYIEGETVTFHPGCKHMFHFECIGEWMMERTICPLCKGPTRSNILRNFDDQKRIIPEEKYEYIFGDEILEDR